MSKFTKFTAIALASIMGGSIVTNGITSVHAAETPINNTVEDQENNFQYTLVRDNDSERVITYTEDQSDVKITYDKKAITLTVERTINGITTTEVIKPQSAMTRGSSMFSPWKYSKSGNRYTLTAVINGKTVSKTVTRTSANGGNIDRFCDAIDDIRSEEWAIVGELVLSGAGGLVFAALTSGIGIPAALSAIGASASALLSGNKINTLYARAKSAYNAL